MWKNRPKPTMDVEFLMTEALDFLMTEDGDYLITEESHYWKEKGKTETTWNNKTKPTGGGWSLKAKPVI